MSGDGLTRDAFLGGRLTILQPKTGYRAGIDPVLLAATVPAQAGQSVLELGCGVGVASLCLLARVPGVLATGVEVQPAYAALARRNAVANDLPLVVVDANLNALPVELRGQQFDHVLANPPYFDRTWGTPAPDTGREVAMGEDTPLADWVEVATRRLTDGGTLTVILRAERLPDLLRAVSPRLGSLCLRPLAPRPGRAATLILLQATKVGRGPFRLLPALDLHAGVRHEDGPKDYSPAVKATLTLGAALAAFEG